MPDDPPLSRATPWARGEPAWPQPVRRTRDAGASSLSALPGRAVASGLGRISRAIPTPVIPIGGAKLKPAPPPLPLAAADHLQTPRQHGLFNHHGIDLGDGSVAHYLEGTAILRSPLEEFSRGQPISAVEYPAEIGRAHV